MMGDASSKQSTPANTRGMRQYVAPLVHLAGENHQAITATWTAKISQKTMR
jgi:hypothetical protein